MKTDNNYIYPETPEELSMFYGLECEIQRGIQKVWVNHEGRIGITTLLIFRDSFSKLKYRLPLPTVNDLKVGDVVKITNNIGHFTRVKEVRNVESSKVLIADHSTSSCELLISRNTWVKVKV